MATEGERKRKFDRVYYAWNPNRYEGPITNTLDIILKPVVKDKP